MKITKYTVSRDDKIYQAWPDLVLLGSGKLLCVFSECTHHGNRSYTRIMLCESFDRGITWSPKQPLTEGTAGLGYYYNNARITQLDDGIVYVTVDRIFGASEDQAESRIIIYRSRDDGKHWDEGIETPARGIVPDKLRQLRSGRRLLSCHHTDPRSGKLVQRLWYSDDRGSHWNGPVAVADDPNLNLCEASLLEVGNTLVAFLRENSFAGLPCYKTFSTDNGLSWSTPIPFPLPGCHRPSAGFLLDGRVMITYRFMQGGRPAWGAFQNLFAGIADLESVLARSYNDALTRIIALDHDCSPQSDTGYSGWVQFPDGEIYVVNYLVDNAVQAYIRGYSFRLAQDEMQPEKTENQEWVIGK